MVYGPAKSSSAVHYISRILPVSAYHSNPCFAIYLLPVNIIGDFFTETVTEAADLALSPTDK